ARRPEHGAPAQERARLSRRITQRTEADPRGRLAWLTGVQARVPAGSVHRRWIVLAASSKDDPDLLFLIQRGALPRNPAPAARVRDREPPLPSLCARRAQARDHQPPRRAALLQADRFHRQQAAEAAAGPSCDTPREPRAEQ